MAILPIFIPHAGCPHQCIFCNQKTISGHSKAAIAYASFQIERWLQWMKPNILNEAAFYGGSFTGLPLDLQEELLQLTDKLIMEGFIGSVRLSTRPDYIDAIRLKLLKKHSVRMVELGVQSLDDRVLQKAERGHTSQQVVEAMKLLKENDFFTGIQLMVGLPMQDFASVKTTGEQAAFLQPDIARIYPVLVIKDTQLAREYMSGNYMPLTLEEAVIQSAWLYRRLTQSDINVIRVGLQADEELCSPGNILAGPFHPAMGELVKSRILRDDCTKKIAFLYEKGLRCVDIYCSYSLESKLRGQKNDNLRFWQQQYPGIKLRIIHEKADGIRICPSANL